MRGKWYRECLGIQNSCVQFYKTELRAVVIKILLKYSGVGYNERCYNERMLKRTVLSIKSGCYNERYYKEQVLKRTVLSIKSGCYNER
jgi:hypothetical protein